MSRPVDRPWQKPVREREKKEFEKPIGTPFKAAACHWGTCLENGDLNATHKETLAAVSL